MTDWRLREGVLLTHIQGVSLLVADKTARKYCRFASRVNETGAFFWQLMSEGKTREAILTAMQQEYEIPEGADPGEDLDRFIRLLRDNHYIISEAEENEV